MTTIKDFTSTIHPSELEAFVSKGARILDVRTPGEYGEAHIEGSMLRPLGSFDALALRHDLKPDDRVLIVCQTDVRSYHAAKQLTEWGYRNVMVVKGGIEECERAGLPLQRGRKAMSLERQVRIAAGSLVLFGVALGIFVHPVAFGLAAFVGAGLVYAGVTDTCGMGMVLARMPWNQR